MRWIVPGLFSQWIWNFYPVTHDRKEKILGELMVVSIFKVQSQYGVIVDAPIILHEPLYLSVEPEFSEEIGRIVDNNISS